MFGLIVAIPMTASFVFLRNRVVKTATYEGMCPGGVRCVLDPE